MFQAFVSYSSEDKAEVIQLKESLKRAGLYIWFDDEQMKTGRTDKLMKDGIDNSQIFICCASSNYAKDKNSNSMKEFDYAIKTKTNEKILYVLIENLKGEKERAEKLNLVYFHMQQELFLKYNDGKNMDKILAAMKNLLKVNQENTVQNVEEEEVVEEDLTERLNEELQKITSKPSFFSLGDREAFTKSTVDDLFKAFPEHNCLVVHPTHRQSFEESHHAQFKFNLFAGIPVYYDIYIFKRGKCQLLGDNGYINWAFKGNYNYDRENKRVEFFDRNN